MGLCPSRNSAKNAKFTQGKTYEPVQPTEALTPTSKLRADAQAFVPKEETKADWELFLEQKRAERAQTGKSRFARRQDGTYTAEYRKLLENDKKPRNPTLKEVQAATGAVSSDLLQAWKDTKPVPKAKNLAAKQRPLDPFQQAVRKAKAMEPASREELLEKLDKAKPVAKDDAATCDNAMRMVPFGLSDRHYASGDEDEAQSHQHRSKKPTPQREYVTKAVTPVLEETMTEVLYGLRVLRQAEEQSRRYCVGLREVMRASKEKGALKAVLVAPDLEQNSKGLDEKLQQLIQTCKQNKTPVVFGLSRLRIGQAIKKSVTVSVLGILDTRGVQEPFGRMVKLA